MEQRFLRLPEVINRTGLSRSSVYLRVNQGRFPKPVHLGPKKIVWPESWISHWIEEQIRAASGEPALAEADEKT